MPQTTKNRDSILKDYGLTTKPPIQHNMTYVQNLYREVMEDGDDEIGGIFKIDQKKKVYKCSQITKDGSSIFNRTEKF